PGAPMQSHPERSPMNRSQMKRTSRLAALLLSVGVVVGAAACFEPPQDINRVQPNYTDKNDLRGEWYTRQMIVDKQYHMSYPFIGYEGPLDRVRFEILQDRLVAFRSYEKVP